jgi:hypothetical protein
MKTFLAIVVVIIIIVIGAFYFIDRTPDVAPVPQQPGISTATSTATTTPGQTTQATSTDRTVIGQSVEGRAITARHFGGGQNEILFVGGIHGGYSPNTSLVAFDLIDYLEANPSAVPANVRVTVVPVLNPDGLNKVMGTTTRFSVASIPAAAQTVPGRFNARNVDLNRNFDCDWQTTGTWQSRQVSGGASAFSEPESQAIRKYIEDNNPEAVVVWYSAAGGVFSSNCHGDVLSDTRTLTNTYAQASGYRPYESFDFYEITGDMVNWLAKRGTPAISVLLTDHRNPEWQKNRAGIDAILKLYATR